MTPLVLLPGMMCDARLFTPQIAALSGRYPLLLAPLAARDSITALARDVLDAAPRRFALAGLSMGGIVAMEILRLAPERVERLALLDTNPSAEGAERRAQRDRQIASVLAGNLETVMRDEMKPNYLADGPGKRPILDLCLAMALDLGPEVFVRQSRALGKRRDQTDTLRHADLPALLLCGEADSLCPPEKHRSMQALIDGSTLEIIPGAGHLPTLEQPEATTAALRRWMES